MANLVIFGLTDGDSGDSTLILTAGFGLSGDFVADRFVRSVDAFTVDMVLDTTPTDQSVLNPASYSITPDLTIRAITKITNRYYRLLTTRQVEGQLYTLTATLIEAI